LSNTLKLAAGAPIRLCWTCYDQQVGAELSLEQPPELGLGILIPGMQLQPVAANATAKFGYR
jgi:hypothetical protein